MVFDNQQNLYNLIFDISLLNKVKLKLKVYQSYNLIYIILNIDFSDNSVVTQYSIVYEIRFILTIYYINNNSSISLIFSNLDLDISILILFFSFFNLIGSLYSLISYFLQLENILFTLHCV